MPEIERELGTVHGVQVKAEAWVTDFFYNNTQRGTCETRIINQTLSLRFVGTNPMVFKPGMPFEAQIAVRYHDQVALTQEQLERSTLRIEAYAKLETGGEVRLDDIRVPRKIEGFSSFQDIDRLRHYGQLYGQDARQDIDEINEINPGNNPCLTSLFVYSFQASAYRSARSKQTTVTSLKNHQNCSFF